MKIIALCTTGLGMTLLCLTGCDRVAPQPSFAEPGWLTSVPDAQAQAKSENKLVLLDFTGSDWCVWCKKLDAEVFSQQAFADYAKSNLVLVEVDFPAQKKLAAALAKANDRRHGGLEPGGLHGRRAPGGDRQIGGSQKKIVPVAPAHCP
jgi:thiol:disulfide interchange protein